MFLGFGLSTFDDEVMENEHDLPEMHQEIDVKASHVRNDRINMKLMDDPVSKGKVGEGGRVVVG